MEVKKSFFPGPTHCIKKRSRSCYYALRKCRRLWFHRSWSSSGWREGCRSLRKSTSRIQDEKNRSQSLPTDFVLTLRTSLSSVLRELPIKTKKPFFIMVIFKTVENGTCHTSRKKMKPVILHRRWLFFFSPHWRINLYYTLRGSTFVFKLHSYRYE